MKAAFIAPIILGALIVISACSPGPSAGPSVPSTEAVGIQPATPSIKMPEATAIPTSTAGISTSPRIPFPRGSGLENLESYTLLVQVGFKGTEKGRLIETTDFYTRSLTLDPPARFTIVQTTVDGKNDIAIHGLVGDTLYSRTGSDVACLAGKSSMKDLRAIDPVYVLKPIRYGRDKGLETVNGATARHYVGDPISNASTLIKGEVWIAEPGNYVVKYALQVKGDESYFGEGTSGEQSIEYDLRDIAAKKAVAIPPGCPPPVLDLPALPDAVGVTRSLNQLSYTTVTGLSKTIAFYQERMKALGWTVESSTGPRDSSALQSPAGLSSMPGMPPNLPGLPPGMPNLPQVTVPASASFGPPGDSWLVFSLAKEQRRAYITMRPEGSGLRIIVQVEQAQ